MYGLAEVDRTIASIHGISLTNNQSDEVRFNHLPLPNNPIYEQ
ncbi:MAG: hypothetical protein N2167_04960 [Flavobacteriales bacterium]|nr:hypothetical protein [Flavobacteriales bacterium]